jgi:hypothetical protein
MSGFAAFTVMMRLRRSDEIREISSAERSHNACGAGSKL